jgi:Nif-specific regulatory protein
MLLADVFAKRFAAEYGKNSASFSVKATNMLNSYTWAGNIRELENSIERAMILSPDGVIHSYHLPEEIRKSVEGGIFKTTGTLSEVLDSVEKEMLVDALSQCKGNRSKAAKMLGITDRIMGLRVQKYHLE